MTSNTTSSAAVGQLEAALTPFPCEKRFMFGCQVYFAEGLMFAGVQGDRIFIRLSPQDRDDFFREYRDAAPFEPMPGRVVREYVVVPSSIAQDTALLEQWLGRSYRFAASLPGKPQRGKNER